MEKKRKYGYHQIISNKQLRGFCHWRAVEDTDKLLQDIQGYQRKISSLEIQKKQRFPESFPVSREELRKAREIANKDTTITLPLSKAIELMKRT